MPKYNVHLFREMRLYFPDIEAESPAEAARIASETDTCEAKEVDDCNGADLGAMVDVVGDQDFSRSALIEFAPARMAKLGPELVAALKSMVEMEYDRDEESRNFDEERLQYFSSLIAQATGTAMMTPGVAHAAGGQNAALLGAAKAALADLQGIMPEFEPSGDRSHPAWKTIEELKSALGQTTRGEQKSGTTATTGIPTETSWGKRHRPHNNSRSGSGRSA